VVYNGVDLGWLRQEPIRKPELIQEGWEVVLVVARVSRWKRHDLALSAFEKLAASNPLVHLVCVGSSDKLEPEWWKLLQESSGRSPFSKRIHWIGQIDDVRPWYQAASVLLLPSENEPFGRVLVEAMACGLAVVATRSGGVPEIVRDGHDGFLVQDLREMVDAILKVLQDKPLRHRLGRSGAERAELFSLTGHVTRMVQVFEESVRE
jgi:glycosyltransferase involved in cell wall biosynthesis